MSEGSGVFAMSKKKIVESVSTDLDIEVGQAGLTVQRLLDTVGAGAGPTIEFCDPSGPAGRSW